MGGPSDITIYQRERFNAQYYAIVEQRLARRRFEQIDKWARTRGRGVLLDLMPIYGRVR